MRLFRIYVSLLLIFFVSCSSRVEIQKEENGRSKISVSDLNPIIDRADIVFWDIGFFGKSEISKGFFVGLKFKPLSEMAVKELYEKYKIDSWLFVVKKKGTNGMEIPFGYYYIPLLVPKSGENVKKEKYSSYKDEKIKNEMEVSFIDSFNFRVYYNAVAFRDTTESYQKCPPQGLRKTLKKISLLGGKQNIKEIFHQERGNVGANTQKVDFLPSVIPAGQSLIGHYVVYMALFNSSLNKQLSEFIKFPQVISVDQEKDLILRGCN